MTVDLRGRDILREADFSAAELTALIQLAASLKNDRRTGTPHRILEGKTIALIFEKASTRTRCAFEVASAHLGATATYIDPSGSHIGHKESAADTARVLSRMYDGIEFRGHSQQTIDQLAKFADVPVLNGLTDEWHPSQMLADFLTMDEHRPRDATRHSYVYLGDARNNMGNSLLVMGAIMGSDVRICAPQDLWPTEQVRALAAERAEHSGARITLTENPQEAVPGAMFVMTDVWVSMGEPEAVWASRVEQLLPYRVDADLMAMAPSSAKFMHCLPAYHDSTTAVGQKVGEQFQLHDGVEVTHDVFESTSSIVFDQAENRLHTIKSMMAATMGDQPID
ncbi:MAG: ornithine carbamoyltransferase [Candidatus Nanopelagicales bacterium]